MDKVAHTEFKYKYICIHVKHQIANSVISDSAKRTTLASGRRSPRTLSANSSGACPDFAGSGYRHTGAIHTTESHYELIKFTPVGSWDDDFGLGW